MSNNELKSLSLERRDDGFALIRRGKGGDLQEMLLDEADILFLPKVLQQSLAEIYSRESNPGSKAYPKAAVEVSGAQLNVTTD